jgi:hypothetical protein
VKSGAGNLAENIVKNARGDLQTGRLVSARCPVAFPAEDTGGAIVWTAVAERFLSPEMLAGDSKGLIGMLALTGLGVVAAAAFAHAFCAGSSGQRRRPACAAEAASARRRPDRVGFGKGSAPASAARKVGFPEGPDDPATPAPPHAPVAARREPPTASAAIPAEPGMILSGESIIRLRERLGAAGDGPDLAACARSPILRALSRCVRHPGPAALPREVREWARRALLNEGAPGKAPPARERARKVGTTEGPDDAARSGQRRCPDDAARPSVGPRRSRERKVA